MKCLNKNCDQMAVENSNYCSQHTLLTSQVYKCEPMMPPGNFQNNSSKMPSPPEYYKSSANYENTSPISKKGFYLIIPVVVLAAIIFIVWLTRFR